MHRRPGRPADYENENRALARLSQALADSPRTILQTLADEILEVFKADSAGVSLLSKEDGGKRFHWPAIAGQWRPHLGGGTPRDFGPCGDVLDRNAPLLFQHFERRYTYFLPITPPVEECLLVPFHVAGKAVGTIWAITHDGRRKFDSEDLRQLESLGRFASAAYQAVELLRTLEQRGAALREADHHKDEFLAMLAHELRNPLAPISNAAQVLRHGAGDREAVHAVSEMLERQVGHLARLLDDLLDVRRIAQGRIELRKEHVELAAVVNHAVEAATPLVQARKHELAVTVPSQPIYVDADPVRLVQVVGNLLNNACKFMDKGGRITLTLEREGPQAVIRVRDRGLGIAADQLPRVFEVFVQVDRSMERTGGGLGIGLTLVRNVVELHRGTVDVRSEGLGHGSEFVVRLPILAETPRLAPKPTAAEPAPARGRRILIVDDSQDGAESLAMLLALGGHEAHMAHDGLEAIEAAERLRPGVVLLDIGLPKVNGYDVCRRIRERPWGKDLVLVAVTGWGQEEDRYRAKAAGFDTHIVKPVDHDVLAKLLAALPARGTSQP